MSLKTSDKIIAIIGVIILIGAGVGIYLYWVSDEDTKEPMEPEDEYVTYNIVPTLKDGESIKKTFTFSKSLLLLSKVNFDNNKFFQISEDNIISININVTYNDGVVGILQKKDTVNVIITDPDGGKHSCNNVEGTKKIKPIEEINKMIDTTPIEAKTYEDAKMELEERYGSKFKDEPFAVHADLKVSFLDLLRPLKRLGERRDPDTVTVEIAYKYYSYELVEETEESNPGNPDNPPTGIKTGTQTWATMALPGKN